ncbi:MAG TPA: YdcH family protein [Nitrospiraceae bacterium]|nr:YdcH family protein [Nitrospiraceae bacterium]
MLTEEVIAERLRQSNTEFRELEASHHRLDLELNELQKRHVLTPAEELEKKRMQKEKLVKKDKIAEFIRIYREQGLQPAAH